MCTKVVAHSAAPYLFTSHLLIYHHIVYLSSGIELQLRYGLSHICLGFVRQGQGQRRRGDSAGGRGRPCAPAQCIDMHMHMRIATENIREQESCTMVLSMRHLTTSLTRTTLAWPWVRTQSGWHMYMEITCTCTCVHAPRVLDRHRYTCMRIVVATKCKQVSSGGRRWRAP